MKSGTITIIAVGWLTVATLPLAAQAPSSSTTRRAVTMPRKDPTPPPTDALEPIQGVPQVRSTPADRAAALSLLEQAKQNSKLHMPDTPPFELRVSFQSWGTKGPGNILFSGTGEATESWLSGQNWRWTAKLGSYSQTRFGRDGIVVDTQPTSVIPMRVQMLREAIYWAVAPTPSSAPIRMGSGQWQGDKLTCLLFSRSLTAPQAGRAWEEEEFCVDAKSGVLKVHSRIPGSWVVYGYAKGREFHGRAEPDQITFYEGGAPIMEAQVDLTDLGSTNPTEQMPTPSGPAVMLARGPTAGIVQRDPSGNQRAVIHATFGSNGKVLETEVASVTDPAAAQRAIEFLSKDRFRPARAAGKQGGLTQTELYLDFIYATR